MCASHGIDIVFRQTLLGGKYGLIDNNFNTNPVKFVSVFKKAAHIDLGLNVDPEMAIANGLYAFRIPNNR